MGIDGDFEARPCVVQKATHVGARGYHPPRHKQHIHQVGKHRRICVRMKRGLRGFVEAKPWTKPTSENRRNKAAPRHAYLHLLSWNVAQQIPGGAAAGKAWSCVKASQRVCTHFCAIWRETITGRSCACKTSPRRMEMWPLRRLSVTGCVAAEALPFVVGGSFCVKGRNCALDVCWEGKKFRVICSQSTPSCDAFARERLGRPSLAGHITWK